MHYQACLPAPFAVLGIRCDESAVIRVDFLPLGTPASPPGNSLAESVCEALKRYLEHPTYHFALPLRASGTPFQSEVWDMICHIPVGQTMTYTELAERVGSGARAVANACGANPFPIVIPCHRVVAAHGLGGFMRSRHADSLNIKRWLLAHERSAPGAAG